MQIIPKFKPRYRIIKYDKRSLKEFCMTEEKNVSPILIAVDEPDLRNRLTQCLKPNLYKTVLSDNSLETLRQNQDEYIAILLDSPADNPASPDLLTKIRTTYPQIPIIFFLVKIMKLE